MENYDERRIKEMAKVYSDEYDDLVLGDSEDIYIDVEATDEAIREWLEARAEQLAGDEPNREDYETEDDFDAAEHAYSERLHEAESESWLEVRNIDVDKFVVSRPAQDEANEVIGIAVRAANRTGHPSAIAIDDEDDFVEAFIATAVRAITGPYQWQEPVIALVKAYARDKWKNEKLN